MSSSLVVGPYTIQFVNHGYLWLDGGAMFGSVPKPLWEKKCPPDEKNRIRLATRSLFIEFEERKLLVDVGSGTKWDEKLQKIFSFEHVGDDKKPYNREAITDVVLTHLHFDHAGGITQFDKEGGLELTFPNATVYLQKDNFELGLSPNIRERASYLASHIEPLQQGKLTLLSGSTEIFPGIWTHQINGHTAGQQYIEIQGKDEILLYPTDLIPTSAHLPLPYHMGYDMCAQTVLEEKQAFLDYALEKDAIVVFEHDPEVPAARISINERGHYGVREVVSISDR